MGHYQLPEVPPACPCAECAELAAAMDADLAARLGVLVAAEKADRRHALNARPRVLARPASGCTRGADGK
jgi:hypothetical protein